MMAGTTSVAAMTTLYVLFGLTLAYIAVPTVVVATISLIWYYDMDRRFRALKKRTNQDAALERHTSKFTPGAVLMHVLLLGVIYR